MLEIFEKDGIKLNVLKKLQCNEGVHQKYLEEDYMNESMTDYKSSDFEGYVKC